MLDRVFRLRDHHTTARTEIIAGVSTFLTMAYIVCLQPAILSGAALGTSTGMDPGAIMVATCLSAAFATALMGFYGRLPIAQAPGMGQNFIFAASLVPAAAAMLQERASGGSPATDAVQAWQVALGVIFIAGVLFLLLTVLGVREAILRALSPSMRNAMAVGIGLFIALIGLKNASLIVTKPGQLTALNFDATSPDIVLFLIGLVITAGLVARRLRGAILIGIAATTVLAVAARELLPLLPESIHGAGAVRDSVLMSDAFRVTYHVVSAPPSLEPTWLKLDVVAALSVRMLPFIFIFLFLDVFDTLGTLVGVCEQANLVRDGEIPRARQAMMSDALGTVVGALCGTSTVTSYIESSAGVSAGGRTGLTAVTAAVLFLLTLFFSPLVLMVGSYPALTAPALVIVGSMMMTSVRRIAWDEPAEALPAFFMMIGIPLFGSITDGMAIGFVSYPLIGALAGRGRTIPWLMWVLAAVLAIYLVWIHPTIGG